MSKCTFQTFDDICLKWNFPFSSNWYISFTERERPTVWWSCCTEAEQCNRYKIYLTYFFSCGSNSGNGSVGKNDFKKYSSFNDMMDFLEMTPQQHHNNTQTMPQWPQFHNLKFTNAQHDEIQHSETIAQHDEIH